MDFVNNNKNQISIRYLDNDTTISIYSKYKKFNNEGFLKIKFDNERWQYYNYVEPSNSKSNTIYITDYKRFIYNMRNKKRIYIKY